MSADREAALHDWLRAHGHDPAALAPLAGDASNRRYLRHPAGVVMDAPPEKGEDTRPFLALTHWLRAAGHSAPEPRAADPGRGFLLLEDLGDNLFARVAGRVPEAELYGAAIDLLAALAALPPPAEIAHPHGTQPLAPYDAAVLEREAMLAPDWYLAAARGRPAEGLRAEFAHLLAAATAAVAPARHVVVLRDYHAENLLWLPGRSGTARVGLLDYQDALAGHPAYDLVSLLEDARRDTAPELRAAMLARFLARTGQEPEAFRAAYAALGAQRNLKIVGIFARLCLRDGKPGYLRLIPRVWDHLMRDLAHPGLAPLAAWVARHLPPPEPALLAALAARAGTGQP